MFPYLRHSDNVTKLAQVTQPLRSQTSKTQEFGVRKGSLMEKAPTRNMGDLMVPQSTLRKYRAQISFTSKEGEMGGTKSN